MRSQRYAELDALRGIAALIVVFGHYAMAYSLNPRLRFHPLFAGRESVMLFFVLSGFVLSLPFWNKGANGPYSRYLVRRVCRIYLPFAAALILSALGAYFFLFSRLNLNSWFNWTWQSPLTPGLFVSQFLMDPAPKLNTAFWSLRYEMQMSIVLPFLLLAMRRIGSKSVLVALALLYVAALRLSAFANPHYIFDTVQYGTMFLLGATLARERVSIRRVWERSSRVARAGFLAISLGLYFYGHMLEFHYKGNYGDFIVAFGACGIIIAALHMPSFAKVLVNPVAQYFGRVSYSLYLLHGTVLFLLLNLLYSKVSSLAFLAIYVFLSLAVSHLFCTFVEEPAMRLGKQLASKPLRSPESLPIAEFG